MRTGYYTPRDWLVICGLATMALTWWVSFGMLRTRTDAVEIGPPGPN